jgi:hypothetical protein
VCYVCVCVCHSHLKISITSCVFKCPINPIANPGPVYNQVHTCGSIIFVCLKPLYLRLNSSVKNLLYSRLVYTDVKIRIYEIIILHVVLYRCETWSLTQKRNID